jgi:hypothetical protein
MPSPIPKPKDQRRNRNPKRSGDWILLSETYKGKIPSVEGLGFGKEAKKWWRTIWRSKVATQWTDEDIPALIELALLRERLLDGKLSVAAEVRLRSDQFGLTPSGRQQRRWMITEEDQERAGVIPSKGTRRGNLKVVDD